jgi:hypothetical protein
MSKKNKKLAKVNALNKTQTELNVQTTNKANLCNANCDYNER